MSIFDIFIAYVSWGHNGKSRPVLIIKQLEDSVVVFSITTQFDNKSDLMRSKYFQINDWKQAGLDKQSYIDTNTTVTLPISSVNTKKPVGILTESDIQKLIEFLTK